MFPLGWNSAGESALSDALDYRGRLKSKSIRTVFTNLSNDPLSVNLNRLTQVEFGRGTRFYLHLHSFFPPVAL